MQQHMFWLAPAPGNTEEELEGENVCSHKKDLGENKVEHTEPVNQRVLESLLGTTRSWFSHQNIYSQHK